jgi:PAS domain S-box-containing protein
MTLSLLLAKFWGWLLAAIGAAFSAWAVHQREKLGKAFAAWRKQRRDRASAWPALLDAVASIQGQLGLLQAMVRAQSDLATEGSFECDPQGRNEMVNRTYARLLGVGQGDLLGLRWKDFIHPDDAVAFLEANAKSLAEHRLFHKRVRMVRSDGDVITVDVTILPHPETPPATRWFGKITLVA